MTLAYQRRPWRNLSQVLCSAYEELFKTSSDKSHWLNLGFLRKFYPEWGDFFYKKPGDADYKYGSLNDLGLTFTDMEQYYKDNWQSYTIAGVEFNAKGYVTRYNYWDPPVVVKVPTEKITLNPTSEPMEHNPSAEMTGEQQAMAYLLASVEEDKVIDDELIATVDTDKDQVITVPELAEVLGESEEDIVDAISGMSEDLELGVIKVVPEGEEEERDDTVVVEVPVDQVTLNPTEEPVEHEPVAELTVEQEAMAVLLDKDQDGVVETEEIAVADTNQDQVITKEEIAEARGEDVQKLEVTFQEVLQKIQEQHIEVVPTITLEVPEEEDIPEVEEVINDPQYDPALPYQWNFAAKVLDNLHKQGTIDWCKFVSNYFRRHHIDSPSIKIIGEELRRVWMSFRANGGPFIDRAYYVDDGFMSDHQFLLIEDLLTDCEIAIGRIQSNNIYLKSLLDTLPTTHLDRLRRHELVRSFTDKLSHIEQTYARL